MLQSGAAKRLQEARWRAGLSRKALAEKTGNRISEATIVKVERNGDADYSPLPQTVYILADALGLDPADLFAEDVPA